MPPPAACNEIFVQLLMTTKMIERIVPERGMAYMYFGKTPFGALNQKRRNKMKQYEKTINKGITLSVLSSISIVLMSRLLYIRINENPGASVPKTRNRRIS